MTRTISTRPHTLTEEHSCQFWWVPPNCTHSRQITGIWWTAELDLRQKPALIRTTYLESPEGQVWALKGRSGLDGRWYSRLPQPPVDFAQLVANRLRTRLTAYQARRRAA